MLSENIKQLRLEKGITQSQLAERLHVVRQTVSKWENGSSVPDALMLQKLANELDTTPDALLDCPTAAASMPPSYPTISKFWLLFTLFWGLFILLTTPLHNAVTRYEAFGPINNKTVMILWETRRFFGFPLFAASVISGMLGLLQERLRLPSLPHSLQLIAVIMLLCGLYASLNCTLLNTLPFPWDLGMQLVTHPHWLILWQTAAAALFHLSTKEKSL